MIKIIDLRNQIRNHQSCRVQVVNFKSQINISRSFSPSLEKELTCVNCSHICYPPERIFQCDEGDVLCSGCGERAADGRLDSCPECMSRLPRQLARNKALEKMAGKHFE